MDDNKSAECIRAFEVYRSSETLCNFVVCFTQLIQLSQIYEWESMKLVINWLQNMNLDQALEQSWLPNNTFTQKENKLARIYFSICCFIITITFFSLPFNDIFDIYVLSVNSIFKVGMLSILYYSYQSLKKQMMKEYPLRYKDIKGSMQTFFACEFISYLLMLAVDLVFIVDQYFNILSNEHLETLSTFFIYVMWGMYPIF